MSVFSHLFLNPKHLYYIYNNENVQNYKENGNTTNISILFMYLGTRKRLLFIHFVDVCWGLDVCQAGSRTESKAANKMKKTLPFFVALTFQWNLLHVWPCLFEWIYSFRSRIFLQCGRPRFHPWVGKTPGRREWLPTPVFLPGEFHGQRTLVGFSLWGHIESDTTEQLTFSLFFHSSSPY